MRHDLIGELGGVDAAAALQLAREVKSNSHRAAALASAAQFQPKAQAVTLLRDAADMAMGEQESVEFLARLGAMAYDLDPVLAGEFWNRALEIVRQPDRIGRGGIDDIAYYMAQGDAAHARLLLESAFARNRVLPGIQAYSLNGLVMAMCAVDVNRALEMAAQIPTDENGSRFEAQRKIAQYLLASPVVRRTLAFNRWGASDNWRPGTPTHW